MFEFINRTTSIKRLQKKRTDIKKILLIGSGPIIIGQACEFDYSGTQSVKTLKELGYEVVLINSNPATIMTDPEFADKTYIEPITEDIVAKIIKKEKVDAILPTMGGQTALNIATSMFNKGLLDGIKFLGANPEAIKKGEDRLEFKKAMQKIGMDLPKSRYAYNYDEAIEAQKLIGFPIIIRASFTLAGSGSGVAYNIEEYKELVKAGLEASPISEILVEESLLGWKEYEMEVIRDNKDNCIIVCSIENFDPMGVHTGDSITVAPALTLTDKEYQNMRDASFKILREIGVDTGGSNVQFSIDPKTGRMIVIEMNPRVSRSSALASKATGYPIAKIATLLAVGFTLDELTNDITNTTASFEPVIDYVVTKIPRWTFDKFPKAKNTLSTSMKSVGEVMAIGKTFNESFQKALCSLETGLAGFDSQSIDIEYIKKEIRRPNEKRALFIMDGFRVGLSKDEVYNLCQIDPWFLSQLYDIYTLEVKTKNNKKQILTDENLLRELKTNGFSDAMIAKLIGCSAYKIYESRQNMSINISYGQVDTCAGEFEAITPYLYSFVNISKEDNENFNELGIDTDFKSVSRSTSETSKVLIIGGGPNRIGQGIEFDYCCVHASFALNDIGIKTIMYNCNPETVSTDYDISNKLYFEPIDFERVQNVIEIEKPDGIIVHFGGQTPLKLANKIANIGGKIIGTTAKVIEMAEDREQFSKFVKKIGLLQPENGTATTLDEANKIANSIGYPVLVRPSFVLGGQGMKIVYSQKELDIYMQKAVDVSNDAPVLVDKFLNNAVELDVDCICDGTDVYIGGIMQHIEEAGIHSGDSACSLPPISLSKGIINDIETKTKLIATKLGVVGLMNTQYAIYKDSIYLIEVNPRASRTVPFVSKATGMPMAKVATRVMWGETLKSSLEFYGKNIIIFENSVYKSKLKKHIAVKEAVFPFDKLDGADTILSPEMKSTGEVMGIGAIFGEAFLKAQNAAKNYLPKTGCVFLTLCDTDKFEAGNIAKSFIKLGFNIVATSGTYETINNLDIKCEKVLKLSEGRPNVIDSLTNKQIVLAINTSDNLSITRDDGKQIRRAVLKSGIPYFTTTAGAYASIEAIKVNQNKQIEPKTIQEYLKN
ncbi:MAG: carbamoyl phosphate synthase large subunit [Epsilonproteobacteria bacterium]|nr:MAG: carbamoyl phosphate synthase large subunit [Campylobacterota bacterium]